VSDVFDTTYNLPANTPVDVKADVFGGMAPIIDTTALDLGEYLLKLEISQAGLYTTTETIGFTVLQPVPTITGAALSPNPAIASGTLVIGCNVPSGTYRATVTFTTPADAVEIVQEMIISGLTATATIDCSELTPGTYTAGHIEIQTITQDGTTGDIDESLWVTILDPEASGLGIEIYFEDALGVKHDLTQANSVYFGKMQLGEIKKMQAFIRNRDTARTLNSVVITPIVHPTEPLGPAENTYEACDLSITESGVFTPALNIASVPPDSTQEIWIRWTIAADANPGWGFFALKAEGVYDV